MKYKIDLNKKDKSLIFLVIIIILIVLGCLFVYDGFVEKSSPIPESDETSVFVKRELL